MFQFFGDHQQHLQIHMISSNIILNFFEDHFRKKLISIYFPADVIFIQGIITQRKFVDLNENRYVSLNFHETPIQTEISPAFVAPRVIITKKCCPPPLISAVRRWRAWPGRVHFAYQPHNARKSGFWIGNGAVIAPQVSGRPPVS